MRLSWAGDEASELIVDVDFEGNAAFGDDAEIAGNLAVLDVDGGWILLPLAGVDVHGSGHVDADFVIAVGQIGGDEVAVTVAVTFLRLGIVARVD